MDNKLLNRIASGDDLSLLSDAERAEYYLAVCESLGLNPLTRPLAWIMFETKGGQRKLTLYALRDCAEQLRRIHKVSITSMTSKIEGDVYIVTVTGMDGEGRTDAASGARSLARDARDARGQLTGATVRLSGNALQNAMMAAETVAKRRLALSLCGLGMLDESEIDSVEAVVPDGPPTIDAPPRKQKADKPAPPPPTADGPPSAESTAAPPREPKTDAPAAPPRKATRVASETITKAQFNEIVKTAQANGHTQTAVLEQIRQRGVARAGELPASEYESLMAWASQPPTPEPPHAPADGAA